MSRSGTNGIPQATLTPHAKLQHIPEPLLQPSRRRNINPLMLSRNLQPLQLLLRKLYLPSLILQSLLTLIQHPKIEIQHKCSKAAHSLQGNTNSQCNGVVRAL